MDAGSAPPVPRCRHGRRLRVVAVPPRARALRRERLRLASVGIVLLAAVVLLASRADLGGAEAGQMGSSWDDGTPVGPIITEIMWSNAGVATDADGDHPDWIELANPTDTPIDLTGYHLSDDARDLARWALPSVTLDPGEHLLVFASGKDRPEPDELHTGFALADGEEPVVLSEPDAITVADAFEAVELPRNTSIGRDPDDPRRWCRFAVPTPGEANTTTCFGDDGFGEPVLSHPAGHYDAPFEVTLEPHEPGATLLYTLDGSTPDPERNPAATRVYDGPIAIDGRSHHDPPLATIDTTVPNEVVPDWPWTTRELRGAQPSATVLRARTPDGHERVATYTVGDEPSTGGLPVLSIIADPRHLFDHDEGILVAGRTFAEHAARPDFDPDAADWANTPRNYTQRGRDWEVPRAEPRPDRIHVQRCAPDCEEAVGVGLRVHGNHSRIYARKSLRLYARDEYGTAAFDAPWFGDDGPVGHRRLLLRNSGQDANHLLFVDGYLQDRFTDLAAETQAFEPTVVYLNGEYWGLLNLRERYDADYLEVVHGADTDEVDLLDRHHEVTHGRADAGEELAALIASFAALEPGTDDFRAHVHDHLDLDSFIDFTAVHVVVGNRDWPLTNVRTWRDRSAIDAPGEGVRDGRWRWMVFDLDHMGRQAGRYEVTYDVFTDRFAPSDDPEHFDGWPFLFHRLMQDDAIRAQWLLRTSDLLNTALEPNDAVAALDGLAARLDDEVARNEARWAIPQVEVWEDRLAGLRRFMTLRAGVQRGQLTEHFAPDGFAQLDLAPTSGDGEVTVNRLTAATREATTTPEGTWSGRYPRSVPIPLRAEPGDGARFDGWWVDGAHAGDDPELTVTLDRDRRVEARFSR
jgi:hypothetical protein